MAGAPTKLPAGASALGCIHCPFGGHAMNNWFTTLLAGILLTFAARGDAAAGPVEDADAALKRGVEAYRRGDKAAQLKEELLALRLLSPLAAQGDTRAEAALGGFYQGGQLRDQKRSAFWFRKAAGHGDSNAQLGLAFDYYRGEGVRKDYAQALIWFQKSADQGNKYGESMLGLIWEAGDGLRKDYPRAAEWFRKAAEQGDAISAVNLGDMYRDGKGLPRNFVQAVALYRKAAERTDADAQFRLAEMYEAGRGVLQDYEQAYMWLCLAAAPQNSEPENAPMNQFDAEIYGKARDELAAKMTPAQIGEAQRLAREWKPMK
jgi:TPR repeat protein